jgi:hypothetical protein
MMRFPRRVDFVLALAAFELNRSGLGGGSVAGVEPVGF